MFKCQMCHKSSMPGERLSLVVAVVRNVEYDHRLTDKRYRGQEIVQQKSVCRGCIEDIGVIGPRVESSVKRIMV
jgi:hypothetical protein